MDLSKIRFTVETDQLKEAIGLLDQLKNASSVLKDANTERKASVQIQREEIKNAKEQERLNTQQQKTAEAAAKAAQAQAKAIKSTGSAQKDASGEMDAATRMVEKQALAMKILRGETISTADGIAFLGNGFTKSQSNMLASLKMLGATGKDMQSLAYSFEEYNRITGVNTFDKSASGIEKMRKELSELNKINSITMSGMALTRDEIVNFMRDSERLVQQQKSEGKSSAWLAEEQDRLKQSYLTTSVELNRLRAESKKMEEQAKSQATAEIKAANDRAKAEDYVAREMNRAEAAYLAAMSNEKINTGSSNRLVKMEEMIRKTGISAQQAEIMLERYKQQLIATQKAGASRAADTVSRALGPQLTDIVVGLSTGQSPLMVLLQQGGQLRDQFALAGVEAAAMGDAMKKAGKEMFTSVVATGKAVGQFIVGSFMDAGKALVTGFTKPVQQATARTATFFAELAAGKGVGYALESSMVAASAGVKGLTGSMLTFTSAVAATGIGALVIGLVAMGVALRESIKEENSLVRAMYLTNTGLSMSATEAMSFAQSMSEVGVTTSDAVEALTSIRNAPKLNKEILEPFIKSAVDLKNVGGPAIKETMKTLTDMGKDPVKALREVGASYGFVTEAMIEQVRQAEKSGDTFKATELAAKLAADAQSSAAQRVMDDLSPLTVLYIDLKKKASEMWDAVKGPTKKQLIDQNLNVARNNLSALEMIGAGKSEKADNLRGYIKLQEQVLQLEKEYNDSVDEGKRRQAAKASVEKKTEAEVLNYRKEKWKALSKEEYAQNRLNQEYTDQYEREALVGESRLAQLEAYYKEWETLRKKDSPREVKDNSLQTEKERLNAILGEQKKGLSDQLAVLKAYRESEFITESQYRDQTSRVYAESLSVQKKALDDWYTASVSSIEKQKVAAKGNQSVVGNLNRSLDALKQTYQSLSNERASDVFAFYTKSALEALKAINDFNLKLIDIGREEEKLAASRKQEKDFSIASLYTDPDVISGMKAFTAEQQRINDKLYELEKEKKKLDSNKVAAQANADMAQTALQYVEALSILKEFEEQTLSAEEAMQRLKDSMKTSPDEAKRNAELQGSISRLNELQNVVRGLDMGSTLAPGFNAATNALGGLLGAMNQLIKYQEDYNKVMKEGTEEQKAQVSAADYRARVSQYAKLSGVTKDYFKQQTAGYKVLSIAEKAFRAVEMYEATKAFLFKTGLADKLNVATIQGYVEAGVAAVASAGKQIAALFGIGQAAATNAVLNQGNGDPYTAFGRMAAMAAVVGALGFSVAGQFTGGGSFGATNEGKGTVLGDKEAASASISKGIDKLKEVNSLGLKYSAEMLVYLSAIESNTRGVASNIARSKNYADFTGMTNTGVFSTGLSKISGTVNRAALAGATMGLSELLGLGGAIQGVANNLFGKSVSIKGQGIIAGDQSLGNILSGGFQGGYYTDVQSKKKFLGMTTSTSKSTNVIEMDQAVQDEITKIFSNFANVIRVATKPLNIPLSEVEQSLQNFVVKIGKIDLKGLNAEEQQKRIEAVFSAEGDRMAEAALSSLKPFQQVGEGFLETVTRVSSSVEEGTAVLNGLNMAVLDYTKLNEKQGDVALELVKESLLLSEGWTKMGEVIASFSGSAQELGDLYKKAIDIRTAFQVLGVSANAMSVDLIKSSGGMDNLSSNWETFQSSFLTESEQMAIQSAILQREFSKIGITMPKTAEEFKKLVLETQNLGTASGDELLGKLLKLSDGFSVLSDQMAKVESERNSLEEKLLELQGNTAEIRRRELEALDPSNRALQEQIWLLEDQKKATDELNSALKQAGKTIADEIKRLLGVTTSGNPAALQTEFALKTAQARAGNVDALNALPELSKAIETLTLGKASTQLEVDTMRAWLAGSLAETMKQLGISVDEVGNVTTGNTLTNPSTSTGGAFYVDNTNQALLSELKTLNAKVADLEAAAVATALSNSKMQKLLDRVAADGNNFSVVVNTESAPVQVQTV